MTNQTVDKEKIADLTIQTVDAFIDKLEFPWNFIQWKHHYMMTGSMFVAKMFGFIPFIPWVIVFLPTFMALIIGAYLGKISYELTVEEENAKIKESNMHTPPLSEDDGGTGETDESGTK